MNILYILQQSIYNNKGQWLTADSNIQMMRGILKQLLKHTDWTFYILIGRIEDFEDIDSYKELIDHKRVIFIPQDFPVDAFLNRQNFDVFKFDILMQKFLPHIDVIWNNITEISRNIKTYLYYRRLDAKLITCCYWLDCPFVDQEKVPYDVSYMWRQYDGFQCSDLAVFTCESTRNAFEANSAFAFDFDITNQIIEKSTVWNFGYSSEELDRHKISKKIRWTLPTILFLNRLSGINYTHHEEFIRAIQLLSRRRNDFQVIFTNPSQKFGWDYLKEQVPNLFIIQKKLLDREMYAILLWNSAISVHLFEKELYGGCSHRESIHCGNITVTPEIHEYALIGGRQFPFYVEAADKPLHLVKVLDDALDHLDFIDLPYFKEIQERNQNLCSYEVVYKGVVEDITNLYWGGWKGGEK